VKTKYNQELLAEKTISAYLEAVRRKGNSAFVKGEHNTADFLTDYSLRSLLLTLGIVDRKKSKTAGDIATKIKAPEIRVKLVLGRLASQGYVSTTSNLTAGKKVSYHLTESGILGTCGVYS
jgi:DNA-binding MarR family transcriptional regulator